MQPTHSHTVQTIIFISFVFRIHFWFREKIQIYPVPYQHVRGILDKIKAATCYNSESKLFRIFAFHCDDYSRKKKLRYKMWRRRSLESTSWRRTSVHVVPKRMKRHAPLFRSWIILPWKTIRVWEIQRNIKAPEKYFFLSFFSFIETHQLLSFLFLQEHYYIYVARRNDRFYI